MRECRRRIDLDALPAGLGVPQPERDACMHFVAAWGGERAGMVEETLFGLDGNREFLIRNIRPPEVIDAPALDLVRPEIESAIRYHGHVVEDAVFCDEFERNGMSRALAQLILGPDPIVGRRSR